MAGRRVEDWSYAVPQEIQLAQYHSPEYRWGDPDLYDDAVSAFAMLTDNPTPCTQMKLLYWLTL